MLFSGTINGRSIRIRLLIPILYRHSPRDQPSTVASFTIILPSEHKGNNFNFDFGPCSESYDMSLPARGQGAVLAWRDGVGIKTGIISEGARVGMSFTIERTPSVDMYLEPTSMQTSVNDFKVLLFRWVSLLQSSPRALVAAPAHLFIPTKEQVDLGRKDLYSLTGGDLQRVLAIRGACEENGFEVALAIMHESRWQHREQASTSTIPPRDSWIEGRSLTGEELPHVSHFSTDELHFLRDSLRTESLDYVRTSEEVCASLQSARRWFDSNQKPSHRA